MAKIMNIKFNEHEIEFDQLQKAFNDIGPDAIYMDHYELAQVTPFSVVMWKLFLTDPRVQDFLQSELALMQQASVRKMMRDIDQSKSTGQAQLLNTLITQSNNSNKKKDGPIFIYTYIPLNKEEQYAPYTETSSSDPFKDNIQ